MENKNILRKEKTKRRYEKKRIVEKSVRRKKRKKCLKNVLKKEEVKYLEYKV